MQPTTDDNQYASMADESLMLAYADGEAAAFDALYARHKPGLYRYFLRQLNNQPELANELFQDVWMKIINARASYQADASFATYLYRIAYNRLVDYWRSNLHKQQHIEYDDSLQVAGLAPADDLQQKQQQEYLKQAIAALPEEQRSAILLKEEGALSLADIAEITGVNRETVKSRLRYAMKHLKQVLNPLRSVI